MIPFVTVDERPDLAQRSANEAEDVWPPHMQHVSHEPVREAFWPRLNREVPALRRAARPGRRPAARRG
jgi:hypothetical protein